MSKERMMSLLFAVNEFDEAFSLYSKVFESPEWDTVQCHEAWEQLTVAMNKLREVALKSDRGQDDY